METRLINVVEVKPELLKQPTGNLEFQCVEDFVDAVDLNEDVVQKKLRRYIVLRLIKRLKELTNDNQ